MPYFLAPLWRIEFSDLAGEERWAHYEKCLKAHDWYYMMSDDHGVYQAGDEQKDMISNMLNTLRSEDQERADGMYYAACPWLDSRGERLEDAW